MFGTLYVWKAKRGDGVFAWLQRFITGVAYRHTSGGIGQLFGDSIEWHLEAYLCVTMTPLPIPTPDECRRFRLIADPTAVRDAFRRGAQFYAGKEYGFLQLPWFVYRRIGELFGINMRKKKNWVPGGQICSELWYNILESLCKAVNDQTALDQLHQWDRTNFHSGDAVNFLVSASTLCVEEI
jgi:hypothetical protein